LKRFLACILLVGHLSGGWALAQAQVGSAPQNLLIITPASNLAENQINLKWDPVPGALGYEVLQKRGSTWWLNEEDPNWTPITSSTSLTGFTADSELEFCVRAVLPGGHSPSSLAVRARTASSTGPAPVSKPAPKVGEESLDLNAPIGDLVPPPPKATRPPKTSTQEAPKGPPPPPPEGLMGFFAGDDRVRLSWRKLAEANGYLVEEQRDGQWITLEKGVIDGNQPSLVLEGYRSPGPYVFRVRATRAGQRSRPSLPTKVER